MIKFFPWLMWWLGSGIILALGFVWMNYRSGQDQNIKDIASSLIFVVCPFIGLVFLGFLLYAILDETEWMNKTLLKGYKPPKSKWYVGYPSEDGVYEVQDPTFEGWTLPRYSRWVASMGWSNSSPDREWLDHSPLPFDPDKQNLHWRLPKL